MPRQQLVKPGLRQIGDTDKYVGKPRGRIDAIESGGADQAVHHRGALTATIRADEQPGFPAARYAAQLSLGRVIADLPVIRAYAGASTGGADSITGGSLIRTSANAVWRRACTPLSAPDIA